MVSTEFNLFNRAQESIECIFPQCIQFIAYFSVCY